MASVISKSEKMTKYTMMKKGKKYEYSAYKNFSLLIVLWISKEF